MTAGPLGEVILRPAPPEAVAEFAGGNIEGLLALGKKPLMSVST